MSESGPQGPGRGPGTPGSESGFKARLQRLEFWIPPSPWCFKLGIFPELCFPRFRIRVGGFLLWAFDWVWRQFDAVWAQLENIPTPSRLWGWIKGNVEWIAEQYTNAVRVSIAWTLNRLVDALKATLEGLKWLTVESFKSLQHNITQLRDFGFWLAGKPTPEERFTFRGLIENTFGSVVDKVLGPVAAGLTGGLEESNRTPTNLKSIEGHVLSIQDEIGAQYRPSPGVGGPELESIEEEMEGIQDLPIPTGVTIDEEEQEEERAE